MKTIWTKLVAGLQQLGSWLSKQWKQFGAQLWVILSRSVLGLVFIFSGFVKAVDPLGTTYKIEDYLKAFGESWSFFKTLLPLAETAAIALITVELVLGICMLLNVRTRWTSWLSVAFYAVMTPLTLYVALKNPVSDCGCFGDALVLTNWQTFWKNVVLISMAILLVAAHRSMRSFFRWQTELGITLTAIACTICLQVYSLTHLPLLDFRPYKVGTNIAEMMEVPDWAPQEEVESVYVMQKEGQTREVSVKDYSQAKAEGWVMTDRKDKVLKKGYEAPIHDFAIFRYVDPSPVAYEELLEGEPMNEEDDNIVSDDDYWAQFGITNEDEEEFADEYEGEDWDEEEDDWYADESMGEDLEITQDILSADRVMLVILYDLDKVDEKDLDAKLTALEDRALRTGEMFYIVTGSSNEKIKEFCEQHDAKSDGAWSFEPELFWATADGVMLKTVVRANPGLVILRAGTICRKYNMRNLSIDDINNTVIL